MRGRTFFFGAALILVGGLLLVDNMGLLPANFNVWGVLWPVALIAMGIMWMVRPGRMMVNRNRQDQALTLRLDTSQRARLRLHHGAGEIHLQGGAAAGVLLDGHFAGGVESNVRQSADETLVDLRVPAPAPFFPDYSDGGMVWQINLAQELPFSLEVETGASRNTLDLRALQVRELLLSTGASDTEIYFPQAAGHTHVVLKSGAAAITAHVPEGVAARVQAQSGMATIQVDTERFPKGMDAYQSADFATAANRVDIHIETGVGSVKII